MTVLNLKNAASLYYGSIEAKKLYYGNQLLWTKPSAVSYDPDAEALFARFLVQPDTTRKQLISDRFVAGKATTWWSKLDGLWVFAAHAPEAGRLNWLRNKYNCLPVNDPTFTIDRGYEGNGTTSYIDTQFNPFVEAPLGSNFQLLSASLGIRCNSESASQSSIAGAWDGTTGITLNPRTAQNGLAGRLNQRGQSTAVLPQPTAISLTAITRVQQTAPIIYWNGDKRGGSGQGADTVLVDRNIVLGGISSTSLRANQFSFAFVGGGMTDAEMVSIYDWWSVYRTAVGLT